VTELDASGCVPRLLRFDRLLLFASRQRGLLRVLRVLDCSCDADVWEQLHEPPGGLSAQRVEALLRAAPALTRLEADLRCDARTAARLVPAPAPDADGADADAAAAVLRVRRLSVVGLWHNREVDEDVEALLAAVRGHVALTQLCVTRLALSPDRAAELLDLALEQRLTTLCLHGCQGLTAALVPALARLLRQGRLEALELRGNGEESQSLWAAPHTPWSACAAERKWRALCAALRACATLRQLTLSGMLAGARWVLGPLVAAVTAHPTLQALCFSATRSASACERAHSDDDHDGASHWVPDAVAHGRALHRIISANAPSLRALCFDGFLTEPGLEAALPALAANTHLRLLGVWCTRRVYTPDGDEPPPALQERFVADVMRPALHASASLRRVRFVPYGETLPDGEDEVEDEEGEARAAARAAAPEREKAQQRLRNALAALSEEVAARHADRRAARDWARSTRRWTAAAPVATTAQPR
jgi:hypothetical protein